MKRKFGINALYLKDCNDIESLALMKEAGFEAFFSESCDPKHVLELKNEAVRLGLDFEFIHSPFYWKTPEGRVIHVNTYWKQDLDYLPLFEKVKLSIDAAKEAEVKTIVHHVGGYWVPPQMNDLGISRFDAMVEYAVKRGVRVAFENLQHIGNISALLDRYENIPEVGFCYDCGHEHCYTETIPFLDLFGKRTFCTHLHDNWGRDKENPMKDADYHLLPFDGNIDYSVMMKKLDRYGYENSLMLECGPGAKYKDLSAPEFFALAYERVKRISES